MRVYQLKEVTPAATEPLVVGGTNGALDVTRHLRIDPADGTEIAYLNRLIKAARRYAENATGRFFIDQTWDLLLPPAQGGFYRRECGFLLSPEEIRIPRAPVKSSGGIVSVKYLDTDGNQQTLAAGTGYVAAVRGETAIVAPPYSVSWPSVRWWIDANGNYPVEVRFTAGYGADGTAVPENFLQAMLLLIGHWYENREEAADVAITKIPMAAEDLLMQDRFHPW